MPFENRVQAAGMLARRLAKYRGDNPVVLAIPRGAVPMGRVVADALDGELDVVLVRKLRAPQNPELAIGSIDEAGNVYLDPDTRELWTDEYLANEKRVQLRTLAERSERYRGWATPIDVAGRVTIVLDDGIATGSTMIAALRAVRSRRPSRLVVATAVASPDAVRQLALEADEVVCLEVPRYMYAIGAHFTDFAQVSDEEVERTLRETRAAHAAL